MKKLLVILHVYYYDQVDWFIRKLSNIKGVEWDLIITHSDMDDSVRAKFEKFKPDTRFVAVENVGYDVWPFIKVLKSIDLSPYDCLMKLHTKNVDGFKCRLNGVKLTGTKWRDILVGGLLNDSAQFTKCIEVFGQYPEVGMVCSYEMLIRPSTKLLEDNILLKMEAKRIGLRKNREPFCAGTMFMIRPVCLKPIIKADLNPSMWSSKNESHSNSTLAHVYERIFGTVVYEAGYQIKGMSAFTSTKMSAMLNRIFKSTINVNYADDGSKYLFLLGQKTIKV